jgi:hypothetical protein
MQDQVAAAGISDFPKQLKSNYIDGTQPSAIPVPAADASAQASVGMAPAPASSSSESDIWKIVALVLLGFVAIALVAVAALFITGYSIRHIKTEVTLESIRTRGFSCESADDLNTPDSAMSDNTELRLEPVRTRGFSGESAASNADDLNTLDSAMSALATDKSETPVVEEINPLATAVPVEASTSKDSDLMEKINTHDNEAVSDFEKMKREASRRWLETPKAEMDTNKAARVEASMSYVLQDEKPRSPVPDGAVDADAEPPMIQTPSSGGSELHTPEPVERTSDGELVIRARPYRPAAEASLPVIEGQAACCEGDKNKDPPPRKNYVLTYD